ncbi:MAG: cytochrome c [Chloroflexi bacterium]|nr:MAG: cytochrome c [Chloroflexota bacterium]
MKRRILITLTILSMPFILGLAITYEVLQVDFLSFMEEQPSVNYREGPRLLPPDGAIPITGVEVPPDGSLPLNPVPATDASIARGKVLYEIHCAVCHGKSGQGDGPVAKYFQSPAPEVSALTDDRIVRHEDGLIYLIITQGFQGMAPMAENLTPQERWDVVNYIRVLQNEN